MGEKLVVPSGADVVVAVVVRDPAGTNYSPYTFPNPSLQQVGINQPLNKPVLDHIDVIDGMVTGIRTPGAADYAGQWPSDWMTIVKDPVTGQATVTVKQDLSSVPDAAKNDDRATSSRRSTRPRGRP